MEEQQQILRASDYKPLEAPEHTACFVCGRSPTWFVEKLTASRKARPMEERGARRICRKCYEAAKVRDQEACRMLQGTFDLSRMERLQVTVGRCSLCDLERAVYRDAGSGVLLCESCYQRELSREKQADAEAGA